MSSPLDERTKEPSGLVTVHFRWEDGRWVFDSAGQEYAEGDGTVGGNYDPTPEERREFAAALVAETETETGAPPRAESGPMRFGDDWAGVFLRGDCAGPMSMLLTEALEAMARGERLDPIQSLQLHGLAEMLGGCHEGGPMPDLQQMRPFEQCFAGQTGEVR